MFVVNTRWRHANPVSAMHKSEVRHSEHVAFWIIDDENKHEGVQDREFFVLEFVFYATLIA